MLPTLVLSSRNKKKIGEVLELLAPHHIPVKGVSDFPHIAEVVEDGDSFATNAAKKACEVAKQLGEWTLGEDSGLCVVALENAPGIYSARYAGEPSSDTRNNEKLLAELKDVPRDKRTAFYVCHAAVSDPEGNVRLSVEGRCYGRIVDDYRGTGGFGYDPLFLIPEYHQTFGQLAPAVKRHLSHRARAFEQLIPKLVTLLTASKRS